MPLTREADIIQESFSQSGRQVKELRRGGGYTGSVAALQYTMLCERMGQATLAALTQEDIRLIAAELGPSFLRVHSHDIVGSWMDGNPEDAADQVAFQIQIMATAAQLELQDPTRGQNIQSFIDASLIIEQQKRGRSP